MGKMWIVAVLVAAALVTGCAPGVIDTAPERNRRVAQISDMTNRQFVDDWDFVWLYDRNVTLTRWHPYIGR